MDAFLSRFREIVARLPEKVAVSDAVRSLSYREIDALSDRIAWVLAADAGSENRIYAYLGRMSCDCVALNIAAGKSGTAVVALDHSHPAAALREIIAHSGAVRIVATPEFEALAREVMEAAPILLPLDAPVRSEIAPYPLVERDPDLLHFISYTSGSTGRPKGVKVSRAICDYRWQQKLGYYGTHESDVVAMFTPFWWYKHIWPLSVGAECACFDFAGEGLGPLEGWMRAKKVTVLLTYTAMYRQLAAAAGAPFPDLRQVIIGGEATRVEDVRNFDRITAPGAAFMSRLACQELAVLTMFTHTHGDRIDYDTVPLGRNMHPGETRLLDAEGREVPRGTPGEIVTKGSLVPPGYHNDPERTAEAFTLHPDGEWSFTMGDLAWEDETGMLHALGRKDQQVKISGYNVRPHEVEEKIALHPDVAEAAVTAFEGAKGIRRLAGFYVPEPGARLTSAELRAFLKAQVPGYMVPSLLIEQETLPRTSNGKLDRKALPAPLELVEAADPRDIEAATPTERVLAEVWRQVLGHGNFGLDDSFFNVGGDSLQAMRMLLEAARPLGYQLPYDTLFLNGADIRSIANQFDAVLKRKSDLGSGGLKVLRQGRRGKTIYLGYMRGGDVSPYLSIMSKMPDAFGFVGLMPRGILDGPRARRLEARMEALSAHCAERILEHADPGEDIHLMGYSFGAVLSAETARALAERGRTVSSLVLIDCPYIWDRPHVALRAIYRFFVRVPEAMKVNLGPRRVAAIGLAALGLGPNPKDVRDANYLAMWRYRPKPVSLPRVLYIRAGENPVGAKWASLWQEVLGPAMQVVTMPGVHDTIMEPPLDGIMAEIIEKWMAAPDESATGLHAHATSTAAE
jgi:acyl-coenzyme A synthetase/AMP-(fatty) acid ligase/thioesterase domain-containing protein